MLVLARAYARDCYLKAMQSGAFDYHEEPLNVAEIFVLLDTLVPRRNGAHPRKSIRGEAGMGRAGTALVAISDREGREALMETLAECGIEPIPCSSVGEVSAILALEATDVLFCDTAFVESGFDHLPRAVSSGELRPPVIVCSRFYDPAMYLEVIQRGAFDYIIYPYGTDEVRWILGSVLHRSSELAPKRPKVVARGHEVVSGDQRAA